jgi:hypothetical protein
LANESQEKEQRDYEKQSGHAVGKEVAFRIAGGKTSLALGRARRGEPRSPRSRLRPVTWE